MLYYALERGVLFIYFVFLRPAPVVVFKLFTPRQAHTQRPITYSRVLTLDHKFYQKGN
jgi:hypothetical protein